MFKHKFIVRIHAFDYEQKTYTRGEPVYLTLEEAKKYYYALVINDGKMKKDLRQMLLEQHKGARREFLLSRAGKYAKDVERDLL